MQINVTCILQAIQFFIAYFFLNRYVFIPFCAVIQKEENFEKSLENKTVDLQTYMRNQDEKNKKSWVNIRQKLLYIAEKNSSNVIDSIHVSEVKIKKSVCELGDLQKSKAKKYLFDHILKVK